MYSILGIFKRAKPNSTVHKNWIEFLVITATLPEISCHRLPSNNDLNYLSLLFLGKSTTEVE